MSTVGRTARCLLGLNATDVALMVGCYMVHLALIEGDYLVEQFTETFHGWEGQKAGRLPMEVGRPYLLRAAAGRFGISLCPA